MHQKQEFYFQSSTGVKTYAIEWRPNKSEPRAVIQLTHGIMEHIDRYDNFASFLAENGFIVVGSDLLGHGKTAQKPEELGFVSEKDGWMSQVRDLRLLYELVRNKYPELPYFLMGHSMGSFLVRTYIASYKEELSGVILSGTAHPPRSLTRLGLTVAQINMRKLTPRGRSRLLDKLNFGSYNKKFRSEMLLRSWLSRDKAVIERYEADPLCGFLPTVGLFFDMLTGINYITNRKNVERIRKDLPIYIFSGDHDPVGAYGKGVRRAYRMLLQAGCTDVQMKLYKGGRHEMLNETIKETVYEDLLEWLLSHLPSKLSQQI